MASLCVAKLRLQNFMSHKDTIFEFDQITSLIGFSNSGKSHVYKALKMLLYHEDFPESRIRYGCKEATVSLELANGIKIERTRTKSTQTVKLTDENGKVSSFTGKKDATSFVNNTLGFRKLVLNPATPSSAEAVNFMGVGELSPLLTGAQPASIQKRLAALLGTDSISQALHTLGQEETGISKRLSGIEVSLDAFENERKGIQKTLDSVDSLVKQVEEVANLLDEKQKNVSKLSDLSRAQKQLVHSITTLEKAKKAGETLAKCTETLAGLQIQELNAELTLAGLRKTFLEKLVTQAQSLFGQLQEKQLLLKTLEEPTQEKNICPTCGKEL